MKKITPLLFVLGLLCTAFSFGSNGNLPKSTKKYFQMSPYVMADDYMAKTIIVNVKKNLRSNCLPNAITNSSNFDFFMHSIGGSNLAKMFPLHKQPEREFKDMGLKMADLSLLYTLKYTYYFILFPLLTDKFIAELC